MNAYVSNTKSIHVAAIILVGLTCFTTFISYYPAALLSSNALSLESIRPSVRLIGILIIVLMTIVKGVQIVDTFMEMRHAPKHWRWLALSYPIIIPLLLTLILYL
ncbi:cytochrome C oxidase subunit IV family protein [Shewanella subflava]|uniref:Cytochrome C oxidase subunit IV family protein n=1 Tax=Shewanella subflava TaxID=2986476 RepID=A0ABT3ICW1_9GAMM|nr:cytochrome C oxidase subunit IV family protein [Shewanella subflava]MCW3173898.1 cytochrome C oxidase subunit IV family protein [Shewanella subflava]